MAEQMYGVLKKIFKHDDFKSDLQKRAVKCVLEGMYPTGDHYMMKLIDKVHGCEERI